MNLNSNSMNMKTRHILTAVSLIILAACTNDSSKKTTLEDQTIIAQTTDINGQPITACQLELVNNTIELPLSYLTEDLKIVPLDNRDEALVGKSNIYISENYILATRSTGSHTIPCKLFHKDGKYICNVGSIGQGPGEYNLIYCAQIDEKGGYIYLLPWNAKALLTYNLKGEYVKSIPLNKKYSNLIVPKGVFRVDSEKNRIAVALLPFSNQPTVAWIQDMEGNVIHEPYADYLKIKPDFSNEINLTRSDSHFGFHVFTFWELRKDTLYHLDMDNGKLLPQFTMDYNNIKMTIHDYHELPGHYMCMVTQPKQIAVGIYETQEQKFIIVDKNTHRGSYVRIINDYLDQSEISHFPYACTDGYYIANMEPAVLMEQIERGLKQPQITDKQRALLESLKKEVDENHNNYILYAKLKTDF